MIASAKKIMTTSSKTDGPFTIRFIDEGSTLLLELTNGCEQTLKCVEILSVFLKDKEGAGRAPSRAHLRFEEINSIQPKERTVLSHKTWIDGKPADTAHDQLGCLKTIAGEFKPYVLDLSWQDAAGKTRYQRIAVGH